MGRIVAGVLFGLFLAGMAAAPGTAAPPPAERVPVRVVGVYCDAPACAPDPRGAWSHGTAFAAAALAALGARRRPR